MDGVVLDPSAFSITFAFAVHDRDARVRRAEIDTNDVFGVRADVRETRFAPSTVPDTFVMMSSSH